MADQEIIHKTEYIERERIEKFFDGIYDCADLTFEPNDHCCAADDCAHCKWREAMKAIQKRILSIHAADVCPVVRGKWIVGKIDDPILEPVGISESFRCSECDYGYVSFDQKRHNFCPNCGADMREERGG